MTIGYDYSIDNNVFLSATSKEYPYVRQAAQTREEQFDKSNTAGENALQSWWYRSQPSFQDGVGMIYLDGRENRSDSRVRARSSLGVDLFNDFGATLLNKMDFKSNDCIPVSVNYKNGIVFVANTTRELVYITDSSATSFSWKTLGETDSLIDITTDGDFIYVSTNKGIWKTKPGTSPTKLYSSTNAVGNIEYLKERLVAVVGDVTNYKIFFLATTTSSTLDMDAITTFSRLFNIATIKSIEEGPNGIYIAGHIENVSNIFYATVNKNPNQDPVLEEFTIIYTTPNNERILSIKQYLNTYLLIGSSKGLRISVFANDGTIVVGSLTIDTQDFYAVGSSVGIESITVSGNYVYAAGWHDPSDPNTDNRGTGLYKVNMNNQLEASTLRFAYQRDVFIPGVNAERIYKCLMFGNTNRVAFFLGSINALYIENATTNVDFGWIDTPYIRMDTLEKKWFAKLTVYRRGPGSIAATSIENYGTLNYDLAFSLGTATAITQELSGSSNNPMTEIAYRFKLLKPVGGNFGTFKGYQVKSQPVEVKQRTIRVPLLCFQREKPLNGRLIERSIQERIQALETLERLGKPVVFQDFITKETLNVFVDNVQFISTALPEDKRVTGYGGIILVTLRTVD